jgi:hypothetical protein
MARFRFTIRGLLIVVVFVAMAVAALRAADAAWDIAVFSLAGSTLLAATLFAVHRTGEKRAFWLGFALFGWVYLAASVHEAVEPRLLSTKVLAYLDSKVPERYVLDEVTIQGLGQTAGSARPHRLTGYSRTLNATVSRSAISLWDAATGKLLSGPGASTEHFIRIGHALVALLAAFAGGTLSRFLFATEHERHSRSIAAPASTEL